MNSVAKLSSKERSELFSETATKMRTTPAVAEKDFWVTWTLGKIFTHPDLRSILKFKGGTSLSKVYHVIERFSEDIDLILDWSLLTDHDPQADRSITQQQKLNKEIDVAGNKYIAEKLLPMLSEVIADVCTCKIADDSPEQVLLYYPRAFSDEYLKPEIRLEIGPLASWVPSETKTILSYAAESFPQIFTEPSCQVHVIKAERTFWEKATILHHEAHRPESSQVPLRLRLSRHYYDVAKMALTPIKDRALADMAMLASVVEFKKKFYPRTWAKYELAKPGTFRLVPQGHVLESVKKDYKAMRNMIYGEYPDYEDIQKVLGDLETEINALT